MKVRKAAIAAAVALCSAGGAARADVIYKFVTTDYGTTKGLPGLPLTAVITLPDSLYTGSFAVSGNGGGSIGRLPTIITSGSTNFVSLMFTVTTTMVVTPALTDAGSFSVALSFTDGYVTASRVSFFDGIDDALISGSGTTASGYIGSDDRACNGDASDMKCFVAGQWIPAPEPMTITLFGSALIGLAVTRRRA